jgi:hypothetical protein
MLAVNDPTLKRLLLELIVEKLDTNGMDELLQAGFEPDFLDVMRHRPARDLIQVANTAQLEINVSLVPQKLASLLTKLDMVRRDTALREYFIRHGASSELACTLFKISVDEYRRLRDLLVEGAVPSGRARMPATKIRDEIHVAWHNLERRQPDTSTREKLYQLHKAFPAFSISALHTTLNEFGEDVFLFKTTAPAPLSHH